MATLPSTSAATTTAALRRAVQWPSLSRRLASVLLQDVRGRCSGLPLQQRSFTSCAVRHQQLWASTWSADSLPCAGRHPSSLSGCRRASTSARGSAPPPDMLFEDLMGMSSVDFDGEEDEDDDDGAAPAKPGKRVVREKKPPPVSDEGLLNVDPSSLARDQLVWAIGRASTLKISDEKLWKGFGKAIADLGEAHLEPSEVCRIMQAFAYAPTEAPLDDRQLQRLLKAFAARAAQYNDERLARMIYGYSKLAAKRKLAVQRFLDFAASEVVERKAMAPWRKLWILRSAGHLPGVGPDFRALLVSQVMQRVGGVVNALNKQYKFKIHCYKTPDLLLRSGCTTCASLSPPRWPRSCRRCRARPPPGAMPAAMTTRTARGRGRRRGLRRGPPRTWRL
mmetsp:Transcript_110789/g.352997  ORF Transcript_110789/g.352997 Transcript_110789/m.352997 type:complete len:393 (+) Transcript_110789:440-1618(+)